MKKQLIYFAVVCIAMIFSSCESEMIRNGTENKLTALADSSLHQDST